MTQPIKVHRHPLSGHCHRVELMLSLLSVPFERVEVDLLKREHKLPDFLSKNALGQVPVIEDGELCLSDSNAILVYLALRYDPSGRWLPREPLAAANVQRWLSLAAGELMRGPGDLRLAALLKKPIDRAVAERTTQDLLGLLETTLEAQPFLVGTDPTLADVALYSYTALAPEGGVSLEPFPALRAWHARVEALPGFIAAHRVKPQPAKSA